MVGHSKLDWFLCSGKINCFGDIKNCQHSASNLQIHLIEIQFKQKSSQPILISILISIWILAEIVLQLDIVHEIAIRKEKNLAVGKNNFRDKIPLLKVEKWWNVLLCINDALHCVLGMKTNMYLLFLLIFRTTRAN